jgi:hypothetical protein
VSEYENLINIGAVDLPCSMLKRAIWTNMGGQTERSEEEEQNLATDF